jgi:MoxR-like ATPase
LATFFAGGHLLLEDIPGVGKTTLAKELSQALGLNFGRIQFTSDMLPSDILGVNYYNQKEGSFVFKKGSIFTSFLLADEINRSMPKTQSALLQAMEEGIVTIDTTPYTLPEPFFIIGTQNPHEEVGTFPLPNSQLDRFMCSFGIGYPDNVSERSILKGETKYLERSLSPSFSEQEIKTYMKQASIVRLSDTLLDFLQDIIAFTRERVDSLSMVCLHVVLWHSLRWLSHGLCCKVEPMLQLMMYKWLQVSFVDTVYVLKRVIPLSYE